jgi:hypothetical protein
VGVEGAKREGGREGGGRKGGNFASDIFLDRVGFIISCHNSFKNNTF